MQPLRRTLLKTLALTLLPGAPALAKPAGAAGASAGLPPALALPGLYDDSLDPAPYLVSEKYDGVRGVWNGRTLRFRSGRVVPAPAWFTARLPHEPLDGELWLGRGRFDELSAIVRKETPAETDWRQVRYMVFELPGAGGAFEARAKRIAEIARQSARPQLVAVEQTAVADRPELRHRLASIVAQGGEGLWLHLATADYRTGRSDTLVNTPATKVD